MEKAAIMNDHFVQELGTPDGQEKVAQLGTDYVRDRLRESSFTPKILKETKVDRNSRNITISTEHDTLGYIDEIQPNSMAVPVTLRGEPRGKFVKGKRYIIGFYGIATARYQAYEIELEAYTMPITDIIKRQAEQDIGAIRDRDFIIHVEGAVQMMQDTVVGNPGLEFTSFTVVEGASSEMSIFKGQLATAGYTAGDAASARDFTVYPIHVNDIIRMEQQLGADGGDRQLELATILMTTTDHADVLRWTLEDLGDQLTSEKIKEGYKYKKLLGWNVVKTIKSTILRRGVLYGFTAPEFIGKFLHYKPAKYEVKKEFGEIQWQTREVVGMGIGNVASMIKCELFPGSVKPGYTNTGYETKIPKPVDQLFQPTHKADEGLISPFIAQF